MALTVVVGGQYGSEGKGKLVSSLVCSNPGPVGVVRSGGPNAGHTAEGCGKRLLLRQVPSGAVDPRCQLYLAAGMQVHVGVLLGEIAALELTPERLAIDPNAVVVTPDDGAREVAGKLRPRIGSTLTGTGAATARKVMRGQDVVRAADVARLKPYLRDVASELNRQLDQGTHVLVEGTQGAGLSLHHGPFPYVTSRDTTASAFLSECGLAPTLVTDTVVVLRTFPIRVAGNSGPLAGELTWEKVAASAGYPTALAEYTTVTGRLRRVADFNWDMAARAVMLNRPTALALHGVDYIAHDDLGARRWDALTIASRRFVDEVESRLNVPVRWLFTGPDGADIIDRGPKHRSKPDPRTPQQTHAFTS